MNTKLYYMEFVTPGADSENCIVEAHSPEEATKLAQENAIRIGMMDEDEINDPDAEVYYLDPEEIEEKTGSPGIRW